MKRLIHRNEPNRPHISSVTINFKEHERRNKMSSALSFGAPRLHCLLFFVLRLVVLRPVWRPVGASLRRW